MHCARPQLRSSTRPVQELSTGPSGGHIHCVLVAACRPEARGATFEILRKNSKYGVCGRLAPFAILCIFWPEHRVIAMGSEELAHCVLRHPELLINTTNLRPWATRSK